MRFEANLSNKSSVDLKLSITCLNYDILLLLIWDNINQ